MFNQSTLTEAPNKPLAMITLSNVIIARGLLEASAQQLGYLPYYFQNQASHACSRQQVFQFYVPEEAWRILQASNQLPRRGYRKGMAG